MKIEKCVLRRTWKVYLAKRNKPWKMVQTRAQRIPTMQSGVTGVSGSSLQDNEQTPIVSDGHENNPASSNDCFSNVEVPNSGLNDPRPQVTPVVLK